MELKSFVVVLFPSDNSVEVVPSKWLSEDQNTCAFPPSPPKGFRELQKNPDASPLSDWPAWNIEIKKAYGEK